ncbi:hypothetical protein EG329_012614 [Mollisiaceae sp. DMI_Dod_QoI]|nr:hypothetical protein EG329_012614 [Helotiales sp. DMI_Dod_QoI]
MASGPLQILPAPSGFARFKYEPLKAFSTKPSIRLAVLEPGTRESNIRITLVTKAFAERPKYEALSYAWGRPNAVRNIELNGTRVQVRMNLWSALVHLRSDTEGRALWIDAICINQTDLEERNEQVQLMAYIYSRAKKVLVWLGVIVIFDSEPHKEKTQEELEKIARSEIYTLTQRPYWWRVWIVQEIGSAMSLEIHWGTTLELDPTAKFISRFESWERFFKRIPLEDEHQNAAVTLARQREGRHGDNFLLANLMVACQRSECEEPRDKVYGFVGIAHDCEDGSFPVDYSKSLFELYDDVIRFHCRSQEGSETVVYFSEVVQRLFGGPISMQQDLNRHTVNSGSDLISYHPKKVDVRAKYHGTISLVGPSYDEFIALPEATRKWKIALSMNDWSSLSHKEFLQRLRRKNEVLMGLLHDLDAPSLAKMTTIQRRLYWDSNPALDNVSLRESEAMGFWHPRQFSQMAESDYIFLEETEDEPRLFSTSNGVIGLMPPQARPGDILFQFAKSSIIAVVRCRDYENYGHGDINARLIGRALVPPEVSEESGNFYVQSTQNQWPTTIVMDLRLLQLLTE